RKERDDDPRHRWTELLNDQSRGHSSAVHLPCPSTGKWLELVDDIGWGRANRDIPTIGQRQARGPSLASVHGKRRDLHRRRCGGGGRRCPRGCRWWCRRQSRAHAVEEWLGGRGSRPPLIRLVPGLQTAESVQIVAQDARMLDEARIG